MRLSSGKERNDAASSPTGGEKGDEIMVKDGNEENLSSGQSRCRIIGWLNVYNSASGLGGQ